MDKLREMSYNSKCKLKPLRPFTQLLEHTSFLIRFHTFFDAFLNFFEPFFELFRAFFERFFRSNPHF
jgi:hypothetical protein